MKRIALHTLGCKLNFAETSTIGRHFRALGYEVVNIDQPADVCVINTCSVTERTDRECRQIVRRALRYSPNAFVVVTGCYAQLRPNEISAIEGVDLVLGMNEKFSIPNLSGGFEKRERAEVMVSPIDEVDTFNPATSAGMTERTRAFLKVQDGCDYTCTFCTIPLARGESRSVPVENIVAHARELVAQGYKEIVLTGVNVGDYGKKIGLSLLSLLKSLDRIDALQRIRISSVEPNLLTDALLELWMSSEKICKHFHLPLQSGSDTVLKSMRRRYMHDWYADRVERIITAYPSAGVGADVIVGFPGETDELFEETYRFLVDMPISYLHVFTYSERPKTAAASFGGSVEPRGRAKRNERLRNLSARKRKTFYERFIGKTVDVLFESDEVRGHVTGLTQEYVRVRAPGDRSWINEILPVTIFGVDGDCCYGLPTASVAVRPPPVRVVEGVFA